MDHSQLPDAGNIPHYEIDARLPTPTEKAELADLVEGVINIIISTADTANPPTDAELDSALGTPAACGPGYVALLDDAGAHANAYLILSDGTAWWYAALTKAT